MHAAQQIYQRVLAAQRILIITHYHPDGDALSSLSVFSCVLKSLGKDFQAYCRTPLTSAHYYLPHLEDVISQLSATDFATFDLIISLDCGSLSRTGIADLILARAPEQFFIEIDHHPQIENVSDLAYRPLGFSATAELLYNFCKLNHLPITTTMATGILTGLVSDTGAFIYQATTAATINAAADMLWQGARLPAVVQTVLRNQSLSALRLWGLALSRLQINHHYGIAYTVLTHQDFADYQVSESATDDLAGWLVCVSGAQALLFLKQSEPGLIKGSWRAIDQTIDVGRLARLMGGGGHAQAAGFAYPGSLSQVNGRWQLN